MDSARRLGRSQMDEMAIKEIEALLPRGSAFGQKQCGTTPPLPPGVSTFNDTCNHLHIQVPKGTP